MLSYQSDRELRAMRKALYVEATHLENGEVGYY